MTAQTIIQNILPLISGSTVAKEDNYDTLLAYLNFAKGKLARDTHMWIGGQDVTLIEGTYEYTLNKIPLQIIEVFDEELNLRPRNNFSYLGYTQTAPNKINVNNPSVGTILNVNWYEEPADYALGDEVNIPSDLIEAMTYFVAHKVFNVYKGDQEELKSKLHIEQYNKIVRDYLERTDTPHIDSIYQFDPILNRGLI